MSKKSKKIQKEKNLQKKRTRKVANRAKYDDLRDSGKNSISLRSRHSSKINKKMRVINHPDGFCGNLACSKCYSQYEKDKILIRFKTLEEIKIYNKIKYFIRINNKKIVKDFQKLIKIKYEAA